jgi:hypothetical protein
MNFKILDLIIFNKWLSKPFKKIEYDIDYKFKKIIYKEVKYSNIILELGGASRPMLHKEDERYKYVGIDIDSSFDSEKYYDLYFCQSIEKSFPLKADLIFSKYLMEHVRNVEISFLNQYEALSSNGKAIHLYPLGFHPFSIANKLLGNENVKKLIPFIKKGSEGYTGYPAFYTLGNSYSLEKFFIKKGIKAEFYYHYGAVDYFSFFFPFALVITLFNFLCKILNLKFFASNVIVVFSKGNDKINKL